MEQKFLNLGYFSNKKINSETRLSEALSNVVYRVETPESKYIVKFFNKGVKYEEYCVPKEFKQKYLHFNENYCVLKYIENYKVDFRKYKKELANALKIIHNGTEKSERTFNDLLKNTFELEIKFVDDFKLKEILTNIYSDCVKLLDCSKLVPCHNDLTFANILKTKKGVFIIDFEYGAMNDPDYEIANLFCEVMADYEDNGILKPELEWSKEEKKEFLRYYFGEMNDFDLKIHKISILENISHFFWYLWAREKIRTLVSFDLFDYREYAIGRIKSMVRSKFIENGDLMVEELNKWIVQ